MRCPHPSMNIFQVLCAVSPPQNESPNAYNFMCIVPTLVITSELEYSSHLVYSVVSPVQLVSSSVALPAKLVILYLLGQLPLQI